MAGQGEQPKKKNQTPNTLEDSGYKHSLKFSWFPHKVTKRFQIIKKGEMVGHRTRKSRDLCEYRI